MTRASQSWQSWHSSQKPDRSGFVCRVPKFANAKLWGPTKFLNAKFWDPASETNHVCFLRLYSDRTFFSHRKRNHSTNTNWLIFPKTGQRDESQQCSIQGLVAAHWPPVILPTWPCACIPARLLRLLTISGTEGFVTRVFLVCCL